MRNAGGSGKATTLMDSASRTRTDAEGGRRGASGAAASTTASVITSTVVRVPAASAGGTGVVPLVSAPGIPFDLFEVLRVF